MNTFYYGLFTVSGVGQRALVIDPANSAVLVDEAVSVATSSARTAKYAELTAKYGELVSITRELEVFIGIDLTDNQPISAILMAGSLNSGTTFTQVCLLVKRNGSSDTVLVDYTYDLPKVNGSVPAASVLWRDSETAYVTCYDANSNLQLVRLSTDGTSSVSTLEGTPEYHANDMGHHVVLSSAGERLLFVATYDDGSYTARLLRDTAGTWTTIATGSATYPVTKTQVQAVLTTAAVTAASVVGRTAVEGDGVSLNEFWDTTRGFIQATVGGYTVQNTATAATTDLSTTITERTGGTNLYGGPEFVYLDADLPAALGYWRNLIGAVETEIP